VPLLHFFKLHSTHFIFSLNSIYHRNLSSTPFTLSYRTLPNVRHLAEDTKGVDKLIVLNNIIARHTLKKYRTLVFCNTVKSCRCALLLLLSCRALPCLALPYLALPCRTLPCLILPSPTQNTSLNFTFSSTTASPSVCHFYNLTLTPVTCILLHRAVEYAMTSTGIDVLSYHGDLNSKER
jgi:hypothetical protein